MHRLIRTLLICCLVPMILTGCFKIPFPTETTAAPTAAVPTTSVATEPQPTTEETQPPEVNYTAEQLLRKTKLAVSNKYAHAYEEVKRHSVRAGSGGVYVRTELEYTTQVLMSTLPFAINLNYQIRIRSMDLEIEQDFHSYLRSDKQDVTMYVYAKHLDQWYSEKRPETPGELTMMYSFNGCPPDYPGDLTLADALVDFEGRQTYVLSYSISGMEVYGSLDDPELDELLAQTRVPVTIHIDAETFRPLQMAMDKTELDNVISGIYPQLVSGDLGELVRGQTIEFSESTHVYRNFIFEEVDIPPLPEDRNEGTGGNSSHL